MTAIRAPNRCRIRTVGRSTARPHGATSSTLRLQHPRSLLSMSRPNIAQSCRKETGQPVQLKLTELTREARRCTISMPSARGPQNACLVFETVPQVQMKPTGVIPHNSLDPTVKCRLCTRTVRSAEQAASFATLTQDELDSDHGHETRRESCRTVLASH